MNSSEARMRERFRQTAELVDIGFELKRQNLRRSHPGATDDEIEAMIKEWLRRKPSDDAGLS